MKRIVWLSFFLSLLTATVAQQRTPEPPKIYRSTAERINDLTHTKLEAKFDYGKQQLNGKVWITLKPHFYPTDSLLLDAKGMDIKEVAIVKGGKNNKLQYKYDGLFLNVNLNKIYKNTKPYTVYIEYKAKPNEFKSK